MSKDAAFDFIPNPQGRPLDDASFLSSALAKEKQEVFGAPALSIFIIAALIIALFAVKAMKR